jgi:hypothetical protein
MSEHRIFEVTPIFVAAVIGAIAFMYFDSTDQNALAHGAATGALIQIGVRLLGVS